MYSVLTVRVNNLRYCGVNCVLSLSPLDVSRECAVDVVFLIRYDLLMK